MSGKNEISGEKKMKFLEKKSEKKIF